VKSSAGGGAKSKKARNVIPYKSDKTGVKTLKKNKKQDRPFKRGNSEHAMNLWTSRKGNAPFPGETGNCWEKVPRDMVLWASIRSPGSREKKKTEERKKNAKKKKRDRGGKARTGRAEGPRERVITRGQH